MCITDYPAPPILNALQKNAEAILPSNKDVLICGLDWTKPEEDTIELLTTFSGGGFTR